MASSRISVVVAIGNAVAARQLTRDLSADPAIAVQTATTAAQLFDSITLARPSVILLDTNLVGPTTPQLVEGLSRQRQLPVVLRADRNDDANMLLDAMDAGALAISTRPGSLGETAELNPSLIWTLRCATDAVVDKLGESLRFEKLQPIGSSESILAFGGGIGSLPALQAILSQLPAGSPGGVAIAPLPAHLVGTWAKRLASRCDVRLNPASHGDVILPGQILIAPGNAHAMVRRTATGLSIAIKDGPAVYSQKPSVEVLFNSLAECAGPSTVAAYLNGSGDDGVTGLLNLRNAGAKTIVQLPSTCLCPDAPARAQRCRAGEFSIPPAQIARQMLDLATQLSIPRAA
jgi:two-component system chemotaxis response regulator CheB